MTIKRDQFGRRITPGTKPDPAGSPATSPQETPTPASNAAAAAKPPQPPADPGRHTFKTTQVTPDSPSSRAPLWLMTMTVLLIAAGIAHGVRYFANRPDPNYLQAKKMVEHYETGRDANMRNYANDIYSGALELLEQVDPESVSAEPARLLQTRIQADIRRFESEREAQQKRVDAEQAKRRERHASMQAARMRAILNPVTEYPECEDEDHSGHKH